MYSIASVLNYSHTPAEGVAHVVLFPDLLYKGTRNGHSSSKHVQLASCSWIMERESGRDRGSYSRISGREMQSLSSSKDKLDKAISALEDSDDEDQGATELSTCSKLA